MVNETWSIKASIWAVSFLGKYIHHRNLITIGKQDTIENYIHV